MAPASPLLPWEVIERVMSHSGDDCRSLLDFSLTCRDLHPRALCLLVADVRFRTTTGRNRTFMFCDFLKANPHLKPFVRSIEISLYEFSPCPLLGLAPNLSKLTFTGASLLRPILNQSILKSCKHLGTHIQILHLSDSFLNLSFATYSDFSRVLLAFTNLTDLVCVNVAIKAEGHRAPLDVLLKQDPPRLRLRTVEIDYIVNHFDINTIVNNSSVTALLLDSGLVQSTVETLTVRAIPYRPYKPSVSPGFRVTWSQLRSLVVKLDLKSFTESRTQPITQCITNAILFLEASPFLTLQDTMVKLHCTSAGIWRFFDANKDFSGETMSRLFKELENTMLRFTQPRIVWFLNGKVFYRTISFWTQQLGKQCFPVLFQRGAFMLTSESVILGAGHNGKVLCIATSPNSKWVATGSNDSTIILWDTGTNGVIAQQWVAHNYRPVHSLAFSTDSCYLLSDSDDSNVKIWDVAEGSKSPEVTATLEARTSCFAWSPRGDIIASGSRDGNVRLRDACTLHGRVRILQHPDGEDLEVVVFSPDGRWLVSGSPLGYHVWDVTSGMLHKSFNPDNMFDLTVAFDPGSTRLLIVESSEARLMDVETGEELAVFRRPMLEWIHHVAFSPDGTMVLARSRYGMVNLWNAHTAVELFSLEGHNTTSDACFSPCGKYIASALEDGTLGLWRTSDGSCVATYPEHRSSEGFKLAFCPDGETLWSGDIRGTVIMRQMRDILPIDEQDP